MNYDKEPDEVIEPYVVTKASTAKIAEVRVVVPKDLKWTVMDTIISTLIVVGAITLIREAYRLGAWFADVMFKATGF